MLDPVARFRELMGAPNNATTEMVLLALAQEIREEWNTVCITFLQANGFEKGARALEFGTRSLSQNAANHSEAGIAESQAPATSEPGDRGVAPTSSAPSAAPSSDTPLTDALFYATLCAPPTTTEEVIQAVELLEQHYEKFADLSRRLETCLRQAIGALENVHCLTSATPTVRKEIDAALAAYRKLEEERLSRDTDSPDYCDHNLGDPRETPDEKEIARLERELTALRARDKECARQLAVRATESDRDLEVIAKLAGQLSAAERALTEQNEDAEIYRWLRDDTAALYQFVSVWLNDSRADNVHRSVKIAMNSARKAGAA